MNLIALEETTEFITDGTHGSPKRTEDLNGIPLLSAKNVFDGEVRWDDFDLVPPSELQEFQKRIRLQKGDVLMTCVGTIGRAAVWLNERPVVFFRSVAIIRPKSTLRPEYLEYVIRSADFQEELRRRTKQSSQGGVYLKDIKSMPIVVPPLEKQERIVSLLDEADELRKLRSQAACRTADLIPALFHEMFGDPSTNSKCWPVKQFGELTANQDGRRKPVRASDRAARKGEFPYYGASGIIDYVEAYIFDETALLIAEDGANLLARSTPIAFMARGKYWVNNHAHVVTDNGKADLNYLCTVLNLRDLADYVTGSAQPKLNQANLNRIPIPVPPLPLQKEFASRVTEIRELEAKQAASRERLDALFQSMLHRAFRGEL